MMYLIVQTWLFLGIAWLIGIVIGFALARDQRSQRHQEIDAELSDLRERAAAREKELDEFRLRVAELEGLPEGARASRVAARDEMLVRMTQLERDLETAHNNEQRRADEVERLRGEVDGFRTRYLEARAKWDEYQTKAEALASAPPPLTLGEQQVVPDDTLRAKVMELEGRLNEANRARDNAIEQLKALTQHIRDPKGQKTADGEASREKISTLHAQIVELEGRLATAFASARETDALKSRIAELQDKLSEAEVALSKAVSSKSDAGPLKARIGELEAELREARAAAPSIPQAASAKAVEEAAAARSRLAETQGKLAEAQRQAKDAQSMRLQIAELEQALERATRQADESRGLKAQVAGLEARLASSETAGGDDVSLLKARLADVEARLLSSSQPSIEFEALRNRVMTLEALLHEAAKSRDEAAILRSKVAELDGRLGLALKAAAELREKV